MDDFVADFIAQAGYEAAKKLRQAETINIVMIHELETLAAKVYYRGKDEYINRKQYGYGPN